MKNAVKIIGFMATITLLSKSCSIPHYKGEYQNVDCILFEKIIIYADHSADVKYVAIPEPINYKIYDIDSNKIRIDQYDFLIDGDFLIETNVLGKGCRLKKIVKDEEK